MSVASVDGAWTRFWYRPVPRARLSVFRAVIYLFVPVEMLLTRWQGEHALVPASWYRPLWVGRLLHLGPPARGTVLVALVAALVLGPVAAAGYARRFAGPAIFAAYAYWCYVGFSYGKVDHDKVALLVALAVLPSVRWVAGRRGFADATPDAASGWALRAVQVTVVLVYLLSAVTKIRVSGPGWATSSILATAITRRGTMLGDVLLHVPAVLTMTQVGILAFEFASPLLLVRGRVGRAYLGLAVAFHAVTYAAITISFRPHLVCLPAFLPLERVTRRAGTPRRVSARGGRRTATAGSARSPG